MSNQFSNTVPVERFGQRLYAQTSLAYALQGLVGLALVPDPQGPEDTYGILEPVLNDVTGEVEVRISRFGQDVGGAEEIIWDGAPLSASDPDEYGAFAHAIIFGNGRRPIVEEDEEGCR